MFFFVMLLTACEPDTDTVADRVLASPEFKRAVAKAVAETLTEADVEAGSVEMDGVDRLALERKLLSKVIDISPALLSWLEQRGSQHHVRELADLTAQENILIEGVSEVNCYASTMIFGLRGDGACADGRDGPDLRCPEFGWDGGDCVPGASADPTVLTNTSDELARRYEPTTCGEQLVFECIKDHPQIKLKGLAASRNVVARFARRLDESVHFTEVWHDQLQSRSIGGIGLIEFNIYVKTIRPNTDEFCDEETEVCDGKAEPHQKKKQAPTTDVELARKMRGYWVPKDSGQPVCERGDGIRFLPDGTLRFWSATEEPSGDHTWKVRGQQLILGGNKPTKVVFTDNNEAIWNHQSWINVGACGGG